MKVELFVFMGQHQHSLSAYHCLQENLLITHFDTFVPNFRRKNTPFTGKSWKCRGIVTKPWERRRPPFGVELNVLFTRFINIISMSLHIKYFNWRNFRGGFMIGWTQAHFSHEKYSALFLMKAGCLISWQVSGVPEPLKSKPLWESDTLKA